MRNALIQKNGHIKNSKRWLKILLREQTQHLEGLPINVFTKRVEKEYFHFHDDLEIILVLRGSIDIKIGYLTSRKTKGDLIIIDSEDLHSIYKTDEDNLLLFVHIDLHHYKQQYPYIDFMIFACESFVSDSIFIKSNIEKKVRQLRKHVVKIMLENSEKKSGYKNRIKELLDAFVLLLINDFQYFFIEDNEFKYNEKSQQNKLSFDRIYRIIMYIYKNYNSKVTLHDIAEHEYLSTYYVSHMIKNTTGLGFQEFLNFVRVGYAEILLLSTEKTITEIAFDCGFSSIKYFNKYFEKWYQYKPNAYRQIWHEDSLHLGKKEYNHFEFSDALKEMTRYIEDEKQDGIQRLKDRKVIEIHNKKTKEKKFIKDTFGFYIPDIRQGFDFSFQLQLKEAVKSIPFKYLGLPDVFKKDVFSNPHDYYSLKQFLDFLMSLNIQPYFLIELPSKIEMDKKLTHIKQFMDTHYSNAVIKRWKYCLLHKSNHIEEAQSFSKSLRHVVQAEVMTSFTSRSILDDYNLLNDTEYITPLLIQSILDYPSSDYVFLNSITDCYSDQPLFHGGKGIMTVHGLKKPSFYVYYLFSKLGNSVLEQGNDHIVTKTGQDIQILLFGEKFSHDAHAFYKEHNCQELSDCSTSFSSNKNDFSIRISNLKGSYKIIRYKNNHESNYIYQNWMDMGCPENITDEDIFLMNMAAFPRVSFDTIFSNYVELHSQISDFGIELIILEKIIQ